MKRLYIKEIKAGEKVLLKGWAFELRSLSNLAFLVLRDSSGSVQCISKESEIMKTISSLTLESVVEITGTVKKANVKAEFARKDIEIEIENLIILNRAEKLPIHVNEKATEPTEISKRLDNRSLDV